MLTVKHFEVVTQQRTNTTWLDDAPNVGVHNDGHSIIARTRIVHGRDIVRTDDGLTHHRQRYLPTVHITSVDSTLADGTRRSSGWRHLQGRHDHGNGLLHAKREQRPSARASAVVLPSRTHVDGSNTSSMVRAV